MGAARGSDLRLVALSNVDNLLPRCCACTKLAKLTPHKEVVISPIHSLSLPNDREVILSPFGATSTVQNLRKPFLCRLLARRLKNALGPPPLHEACQAHPHNI